MICPTLHRSADGAGGGFEPRPKAEDFKSLRRRSATRPGGIVGKAAPGRHPDAGRQRVPCWRREGWRRRPESNRRMRVCDPCPPLLRRPEARAARGGLSSRLVATRRRRRRGISERETDLNPRPQPWQGCALPLSYSRPPEAEGYEQRRSLSSRRGHREGVAHERDLPAAIGAAIETEDIETARPRPRMGDEIERGGAG